MTDAAVPMWFSSALKALCAGDIDAFVAMYAEDAVHEFPFAPSDGIRRLEGKADIAAYMSQLPAMVKLDSFDNVCVRETGAELIVEAEGHGRHSDDGTPFHMQYVWFITHDDGVVSRFRDYMNPLALSA